MTTLFGDRRDVDVSDHVPVFALYHGGVHRLRCEVCGYLWPCPDVSGRTRALEPEERELIEVLDIGIGFSIYDRGASEAGREVIPGGVVIGWTDDEGEGRTYTVLDFHRGRARFDRLRADDIDPATVGMPNTATIRNYVRQLAREAGAGKGALTPADVELIEHAFTLTRAL